MEKLLKLANELDAKGLQKEADIIDSFVKEAGALVTIAAWIAGKLSDETLVGIANELPSQRLAELAKKMDKEKQKEVIRLLVGDPEMQAVAMEVLGLPPGLAGAAGELLGELGASPGAGQMPELGNLEGLFGLGDQVAGTALKP